MTPERLAHLKRWSKHGNGGQALADTLAEIDCLTQRWEALTTFIDDCTSVDVKVIQDEIDRLEREP